jgi:hypothetical protein
VKYQRRVNRKLTDQSSARPDDDGVLAGPCWPNDAALPRVVRRHGEVMLDEGWVRIEDDDPAESQAAP